ncbi:hypothetical protein MicvaDRAFT_3989 [Microcoleus vaginatus FGP-2]|nr:hypothetical protein MicvaDRAFT_3989 [Microcoleus vaginatus FGP-2]
MEVGRRKRGRVGVGEGEAESGKIAQFPIPNSQFPILFGPIPNSLRRRCFSAQFPIPNSPFPIP